MIIWSCMTSEEGGAHNIYLKNSPYREGVKIPVEGTQFDLEFHVSWEPRRIPMSSPPTSYISNHLLRFGNSALKNIQDILGKEFKHNILYPHLLIGYPQQSSVRERTKMRDNLAQFFYDCEIGVPLRDIRYADLLSWCDAMSLKDDLLSHFGVLNAKTSTKAARVDAMRHISKLMNKCILERDPYGDIQKYDTTYI